MQNCSVNQRRRIKCKYRGMRSIDIMYLNCKRDRNNFRGIKAMPHLFLYKCTYIHARMQYEKNNSVMDTQHHNAQHPVNLLKKRQRLNLGRRVVRCRLQRGDETPPLAARAEVLRPENQSAAVFSGQYAVVSGTVAGHVHLSGAKEVPGKT